MKALTNRFVKTLVFIYMPGTSIFYVTVALGKAGPAFLGIDQNMATMALIAGSLLGWVVTAILMRSLKYLTIEPALRVSLQLIILISMALCSLLILWSV